jgi:hypothetical protein
LEIEEFEKVSFAGLILVQEKEIARSTHGPRAIVSPQSADMVEVKVVR